MTVNSTHDQAASRALAVLQAVRVFTCELQDLKELVTVLERDVSVPARVKYRQLSDGLRAVTRAAQDVHLLLEELPHSVRDLPDEDDEDGEPEEA